MKLHETGRLNFRPWRRSGATSRPAEMVVAVDSLGDQNIFPRVRCMKVFGVQGAPREDPAIPFTERQLAEVKHMFSHVFLVLRYATLSQVVDSFGASLRIPRGIEHDKFPSNKDPAFRLVAWGPHVEASRLSRRLDRVRLISVEASLTTGLSTLLLASGVSLNRDEQLKLRLKDGAATVQLDDGTWRVNMARSIVQAPPMFDLRSN